MPNEYHNPKGKRVVLKLADLIFDPRLRMRQNGSNSHHVQDLRDAIKAGAKMPDIQVRAVAEQGNFVTDGAHTGEALIAEGKTEATCWVKPGSWTDAVIDAAAANVEHNALKRTPDDKRLAVLTCIRALGDARINWGVRAIAEHCKVSPSFVSEIKKKVEEIEGNRPAEKSTGRDGVERKKPRQAPKPEAEKDVPSIDGTWRQMPVLEWINTQSYVTGKIAEAGIVTTGELFDAIVSGGVTGVSGMHTEGFLETIKKMQGFDGVIPERKRELYDWTGFELDFGRLARRINDCATSNGGLSETSKSLNKQLNEFWAAVEAWKAQIIKENEHGQEEGN